MAQIQWLQFPLEIKWYITGKCNLRCSHCYLSSYVDHPDLTKIDQIIEFLATKKMHSISLLGGEPLIRSDLEQIVQHITIKNINVAVATNATLLSTNRAMSLFDNGLRNIQVSLESIVDAEHDKIRGAGTFEKTLRGIKAAQLVGINVILAFTIKKTNISEIGEYFKFAQRLNISQICIMPFLPVGTGGKNQRNLKLSSGDFEYCSQLILAHQLQFPTMSVNSYFTDLKPSCSGCYKSTFGCGAGTTSIVINSDFSLSACDIMVEEDRTQIIEHPSDIEKFWKNHPLFEKWRGTDPSAKTKSINNFSDVHLRGCHVLNHTYA